MLEEFFLTWKKGIVFFYFYVIIGIKWEKRRKHETHTRK